MNMHFRNTYQSFTPDGKLWCETTNAEEVYELSKDVPGITYRKIVTELVDRVEEWDPTKEV